MQTHDLQRNNPLTKKRQIGRGGKRGTTAGRGTKGQKARAGHKIRPEIRDILKKIPKKRGYRFSPVSVKASGVNLAVIDANFSSGDTVSPATLTKKKLVSRIGGKLPSVKILAVGDLTVKNLTFSGCQMSTSARDKLTQAGAKIED